MQSYGCRRGRLGKIKTQIGQDPNAEERVKIALLYANGRGTKRGIVSELAWEWGVDRSTIRRIHNVAAYAESFTSQRGRAEARKIMDVLENQEAVIKIVEDANGRISGRRLEAAFRNATGIAVTRKTLVKYLKSIGLQICRRRYKPMLTEVHKMTRFMYGQQYMHQEWDRWIDLDEKWFVRSH